MSSSSVPYFKVVQTSSKGKFELCAVPSAWECNGILKWPPMDNNKKATINAITKLMQNASSVPGQNWKEFRCVLKRTNLLTMEDAEAQIDAMTNESDTSSNESDTKKMPPPTTSSRRPKRQATTIVLKNADLDRNNFNCVVC